MGLSLFVGTIDKRNIVKYDTTRTIGSCLTKDFMNALAARMFAALFLILSLVAFAFTRTAQLEGKLTAGWCTLCYGFEAVLILITFVLMFVGFKK